MIHRAHINLRCFTAIFAYEVMVMIVAAFHSKKFFSIEFRRLEDAYGMIKVQVSIDGVEADFGMALFHICIYISGRSIAVCAFKKMQDILALVGCLISFFLKTYDRLSFIHNTFLHLILIVSVYRKAWRTFNLLIIRFQPMANNRMAIAAITMVPPGGMRK